MENQFTPEMLAALKSYADTTKANSPGGIALKKADEKANAVLARFKNQLDVTTQAASAQAGSPLDIPQDVRPSKDQMLFMALADLGERLTSRVPEAQRGNKVTPLDKFREMSKEETDRRLRNSQLKSQDERARLAAVHDAELLKLKGVETELGLARDDVRAAQAQQNTLSDQAFRDRQFSRGVKESDRDYEFRVNESNRAQGNIEAALNWDKEKFNTSDWDLASRDYAKMVKGGMDPAKAEARAFGKFLLLEQNIELGDMQLKEKAELMKLLPAQIADQIAEYEYNKIVRPLNIAQIRANIAATRSGGMGGTPVDPLVGHRKRMGEVQKVIDDLSKTKSGFDAQGQASYNKTITDYKNELMRLQSEANELVPNSYPHAYPSVDDWNAAVGTALRLIFGKGK